ncbi:MAG: alkaline phosphatase family protein [Acidimicrobiales bacterium]
MTDSLEPLDRRGAPTMSRRSFLAASTAAAGLAAIGSNAGRLIEAAAAVEPSTSRGIKEIDHVVILMQENRSFDHYFGTLSGTRGFSDGRALRQRVGGERYPIFDQFGYAPGVGVDPTRFLQPFHLESDPPTENGDTTNDITHAWAPQHQSWDNGAMDAFVSTHIATANDGPDNGFVTMGYYTRDDLAFYYALADAFCICDGYHCSVLGPTDPNRVMSISASIDPAGVAGGPVVETYSDRAEYYGAFSWKTMPEALTAGGVSWKVYNDPTALFELSPFPYFSQYWGASAQPELVANAITPTYPTSFVADVAAGTLPSVSWIMSPLAECEHPAAPPEYGEYFTSQVLQTLVANPDVWATTALFITYDENGGFFDHVPPPTAPEGTPGEYLTVSPLPSAASNIAGPIGLGFRVPCLVVSPFSAGGWYCPQTFDHTSLLRFIETRFGVEVPNLTAWRRSVTGDLTQALPLANPNTSVPSLPATSLGETSVAEQAVINALAGTEDVGIPYPPPTVNSMPAQETSPARKRTG